MKIDSIDIFRVAMPLVYPFRTAYGDEHVIESVIVGMRSGDLVGWGESAPGAAPSYSPEWAGGVFTMLRDIAAPRLSGCDIEDGSDLQERLAFIKGNPFAKGALDAAWWDLTAQAQGVPLWRLIGGQRETVDVGADFGVMEEVDSLLAVISEAVDNGYHRVKLKYRPGWDLPVVEAVRNRFPGLVMHIDCNSSYTLDDLPMFRELDRFGLAMIEQPLAYDDLFDHAVLQSGIDTPVCLDESITSPRKARAACELGACRYINIKPGRVGGITPSLEIHRIASEAGIPCWVGGMLESAIGASHCLALATLPNIAYPSDIFPTDRFYEHDVGIPAMIHSSPGCFTPHDNPGIGVSPDRERLEAVICERAHVC